MQHTRDRTRTGLYLGLALCLGLALLTNAMEAEPQGKMEAELAALTNAMEAEPQGKIVKVEDGGVSDNHDDNDDKEIKSGPIVKLEDSKIPATVLVGATNAGKSTFGNMLGRLDHPEKELFVQSGAVKSETKWVKSHLIDVNPQNQELIGDKQLLVIDTPGFGDSDGGDNEIRHVMIQHVTAYKARYGKDFGVNNFVILLDWHKERLNDMIREMLLYLVEMWSEKFMDHVTIVITKWPYDDAGVGDVEAAKGDATPGLVQTKNMFKKTIQKQIAEWFDHYREKGKANGWVIPQQRVDQIRAGALEDKIFFIDSTYDKRSDLTPEEKTDARREVVRFLETMKKPKYACDPAHMNPNVKDRVTQLDEQLEELKEETTQFEMKAKETINGLEKQLAELQRQRDRDHDLFQKMLRDEKLDHATKMLRQEEEHQRQRKHMEHMEELKHAKDDVIRELRKRTDELNKQTDLHKAVIKKLEETKSCWEDIVTAVGAAVLVVSKVVNVIPVVGQVASAAAAAAGGVMIAVAEISRACKK